MNPLLEAVKLLAESRDAIDAALDLDPRPWPASVNEVADVALESADRALDAAIIVALGSGVSIEVVEAAVGRPVLKPDWFVD